MPTFVLNDENVINSYGFRVLNAGLDFAAFDQNPVMLDSHVNSIENTLGSWNNRRVEESKLKMDTVFDSEDPKVKPIEGKVTRGFIKGASLGLAFDFADMKKGPDGNWELTKSQVKEASLCAVPSNSASLQLYNKNGELLPESEVKLSLQKLSANDLQTPNTPQMEKIILTTEAMSALLSAGVTNGDNVTEISRGIVKLQQELSAERQSAKEWKEKHEKQVKLQAASLIDGAVLEGKLLAGERDEWVAFAESKYELAAKQIAKMSSPSSLSNQVVANAADGNIKTVDDFEKLSNEAKLAFKAKNPDAYKKLFA